VSVPELTPACAAPSCSAGSEVRFLGLTPLCPRHAAKAHRRAAGNVLVVGLALVALGLGLVAAEVETLGGSVAGAGALVAALRVWFARRARALAQATTSGPE